MQTYSRSLLREYFRQRDSRAGTDPDIGPDLTIIQDPDDANAYVFGTALQITPGASTDIFDIRLQSAVEGQPSTYIGFAIGVHTADSWDSTTNSSKIKISSGEYAFGMGSGHDSDRYQVIQINQYATMAELGMSAGTLYYVRPIGLIHSQAGAFKTGFNTSHSINQNRFQIMRLGV